MMIGQDIAGLEYCIGLSIKGKLSTVSFLCENKVAIYKDGFAELKIKKFKTHKDASDCADILERDVLYNPDSKQEIMKDVEVSVKNKYGAYLGSLYFIKDDEIIKRLSEEGHHLMIFTTNNDGNLVTSNRDGSRGYINLDKIYIGDGKLSENKSSIMVDAMNVPGGDDAMKVFEKTKAEHPEVTENSHIEILL